MALTAAQVAMNFIKGDNLFTEQVAFSGDVPDANHLPGGTDHQMSFNNAALAQMAEQSRGLAA
jgi:hypothetical protein